MFLPQFKQNIILWKTLPQKYLIIFTYRIGTSVRDRERAREREKERERVTKAR